MSYAHALMLNEDQTAQEVRIACNADAQHWTSLAGDAARELRQTILVGADLIPRALIEDEIA